MFYEGSEKKAEVHINKKEISLLREFDDAFWHKLVEASQAKVLSKIVNSDCSAYLLSESSLFVWHDRFSIITCGETRTVNAVDFFIEHVGKNAVAQITYQRKNEYFSHAQPTSFHDDVKFLSKLVKGKAYRFGDLDGHHCFLFQQLISKSSDLGKGSKESSKKAVPKHNKEVSGASFPEKSYEYMAYHIAESALKTLCNVNVSNLEIRAFLEVDALLPDFIIDDFVFTPAGYSLNAIKGKSYLTIHVTPQSDSSYISAEANFDFFDHLPVFTKILNPKSYDLLTSNVEDFAERIKSTNQNAYLRKALVRKTLDNGKLTCFASMIKPVTDFSDPIEIKL